MSTYPSLTERLNLFMQGNQSVVDALLREVLPKLHEIAVRELKRARYMAPLSDSPYTSRHPYVGSESANSQVYDSSTGSPQALPLSGTGQ